MNILWLAHRDPINPKAGGAERTIFEVAARLIAWGNKVTLVTAGWKDSKARQDVNGIKVIRLGNSVTLHLLLPLFLLFNRFDVIINDLGHAIPWASASFLFKNNIVFFHHLHAKSLPGQVNPVLAKIITAVEKSYPMLYMGNIFVTESKTSVDDLVGLGIERSMIVKIPPGVDSSIFHASEKTPNPSIVYFGGMRRYKRPEECIYVVENLKDKIPGLKLYIVGEGPELGNLLDLVKTRGLDSVVTFLGRVDYSELGRIVASSWLNIHSSVTEGWGFSILEASSAGTPTAAYDVPGVVETIENGANGLKVKDGDREALAEAVYKILKDPNELWLSSMKFAEKYSWDATAELWSKTIKKVEGEQS
ncbi:MAG: hypothetical protein AMDU3_IPLC00001G0250 [Thermoplasmatales archaeon I-plasma]|nr:MAG: hypothetical protein AMDU3_IPLC00001G0250 [Thermoplasmatales archaeon I-plasma]